MSIREDLHELPDRVRRYLDGMVSVHPALVPDEPESADRVAEELAALWHTMDREEQLFVAGLSGDLYQLVGEDLPLGEDTDERVVRASFTAHALKTCLSQLRRVAAACLASQKFLIRGAAWKALGYQGPTSRFTSEAFQALVKELHGGQLTPEHFVPFRATDQQLGAPVGTVFLWHVQDWIRFTDQVRAGLDPGDGPIITGESTLFLFAAKFLLDRGQPPKSVWRVFPEIRQALVEAAKLRRGRAYMVADPTAATTWLYAQDRPLSVTDPELADKWVLDLTALQDAIRGGAVDVVDSLSLAGLTRSTEDLQPSDLEHLYSPEIMVQRPAA